MYIASTRFHSLCNKATRVFLLAVLALWFFSLIVFHLPPPAEAGDKTAVIAIDPELKDGPKFYLNSPRILAEIKWYQTNGYRIIAVAGNPDDIAGALLNYDVKAITFVGEGGLRNPDGTPKSALAGLDAASWRAKIRMALLQRMRQNNIPIDEAAARADRSVVNFGLERMVNYSCYSLSDTSIAELFVRPGGIYHGSSVLYSANPLSFVYFWFTDKMQFFLEPYSVPDQPGELAGILGSWEFGRMENFMLGTVVLTSKQGRHGLVVQGYRHPNETYWRYGGKNDLSFVHRDGYITTHFTRVNPGFWKGPFIPPKGWGKLDKQVIHYLKRK